MNQVMRYKANNDTFNTNVSNLIQISTFVSKSELISLTEDYTMNRETLFCFIRPWHSMIKIKHECCFSSSDVPMWPVC